MQDRPKPSSRKAKDVVIGVTAFKARSLELINAVATGKLERVVLTRRGKAVAEIRASGGRTGRRSRIADPWGHMKGAMWIDPAWDPTEPFADIEWDAEKGILFND